jgi:transcriptional regulator with XRE-family HTH domain
MSADNVRDDPSAPHSGNRKPSMEIRYRLADNLRRYRSYRGYTQEALAKVCGLHRNYVSNVEQATVNITLANLEALATGLLCGEDELLRRQLLLPGFR